MKKLLLSMLSLFAVATVWAQVPFKATTIVNGEFAPGTTWYTMGIGEGLKLIKDNAGADHIALGTSLAKGKDDELWCFVGDATNGYAVYNKQTGTGKVLASKTTMSALAGYGGTGGSTYPTMQDKNALPEGYVGTWDFSRSDKISGVNGYFMKIHGTNYAVNNFAGIGKLAFWAEGTDAGSTIAITPAEATIEILVSTGSFTASNANGTWHSKWESNEVAGFSLSLNANNMQPSGDCISGFSGQSGSCTYTLTAPEGLAVAGYSFDFVNSSSENYQQTLNVAGKTYTSSNTKQSVNVEIAEPARTAFFTQSGANKGITYSNFKVYLKLDVRVPEPAFDVFPTRTTSDIPYRIPAIATAKNGNIIAVADYRHSRADIGMATNGRIDLRARISTDNGETWGEIFDIVQGKGADGINASNNDMYVGFGDPCIVADRESDRILVISCSGNVSFPNGQRNNHQGIAHFYSTDGKNWTTPVDRSESIYSQFDNTQYGPVRAMFVGSGKISQSKYIKVKDYYRIYCAVLVKDVNGTHVNFALYSDDFGETWTVLGGGGVSPIPSGGDEPKADELPDGSVIISSRTTGGRIYNIFSYTDSKKAEGSWGAATYSNASNNGTVAVSNSTNGEIMCVPVRRKADDKKMFLALQSVPLGSGRANVGIYYKELETLADFVSPKAIAADWDGRHQSSYVAGAYSTMTLQKDNNVGFLYEEDTYGTSGGGYTIVYKNYSIEYITDSAYVYDTEVEPLAFIAENINDKMNGAQNYVGCVNTRSPEVLAAVMAYKNSPSYDGYIAINKALKEADGSIELVPNAWYRVRNTERKNATLYLQPEAERVSAAALETSNADQIFSFIPANDDKKYYLYNVNYEYYLGALGVDETQPVVTSSTDNAGVWSLITRANGKSSIVCENKTGSHTGLHLAGDNQRLVPWTNDEAASLWYIEPVEEVALTIDEYLTVCMPFAMAVPEGVTVYVAGDVVNDELSGVKCIALEEYAGDVIAARMPVVLVAESDEYTFKIVENADAVTVNNKLKGVLKSATVTDSGVYALNGKTFVKHNSALPANVAYYVSDCGAEELSMKAGDEILSVKGVEVEQDVKLYDLKGNLVEKPVRGIYVTSEGKKILVY